MTMLRQISIALTDNGAIGVGEDLLFHSSMDMKNFASLTQRTVMIAGTTTARQMMRMKAGVTLDSNRPMVVIGKSDVRPNAKSREWLFFADDFASGIKLAEEVAEDMCLSGWTIVGGRQVYNSFLASNISVNRAYVAEAHFEPIQPVEDQVVVATPATLLAQLKAKMAIPLHTCMSRTVMMVVDEEDVRHAVTFHWIHDEHEVNPKTVKELKDSLVIDTNAGVLTIPKNSISGYLAQRERNAVQIITPGGQVHDVRFTSSGRQSIAFLTHTLDKVIN